MLDRQLAVHGEPVGLVVNGVEQAAPVPALVRGFKPEALVGALRQGDRSVVLSPTGLAALPGQDDGVIIEGRRCNVEQAEIIRMGNSVVRINLVARG